MRRIREYEDVSYTENPITMEEKQRGCRVTNSGTYPYLRLHCDVEGLQFPKSVILRLNLENRIADPWSGRKLFRQMGKALGLQDCPMEIGHPVPVIHDKDVLVELGVRKRRGSSESENEAVNFAPVNSRPSYLAPGTEIVDVVGSAVNKAAQSNTFNDNDIPF